MTALTEAVRQAISDLGGLNIENVSRPTVFTISVITGNLVDALLAEPSDAIPYDQLSMAERSRLMIEELDAAADSRTRYSNDPIDGLLAAAARMIEALAAPVAEPAASEAHAMDRGDAVNLARSMLEVHECKGITPRGVRILSEAVMAMDAALAASAPPQPVLTVEQQRELCSQLLNSQPATREEIEAEPVTDEEFDPLAERLHAQMTALRSQPVALTVQEAFDRSTTTRYVDGRDQAQTTGAQPVARGRVVDGIHWLGSPAPETIPTARLQPVAQGDGAAFWCMTAQGELDGVESDDTNNCLKAAISALSKAQVALDADRAARSNLQVGGDVPKNVALVCEALVPGGVKRYLDYRASDLPEPGTWLAAAPSSAGSEKL